VRKTDEGQAPVSRETFGDRVKRLRLERELTIYKLAERSGVFWTYLSGIENGHRRDPGLSVIQRIAAGLGVKPSELVDGLAPAPLKQRKRKVSG
jgi:transcriptional regulator with XRE-family HTH domain